jgi:hypothetical protein
MRHLTEGNAIDLFVVYKLIRKLTTPFNQTDAYKLGIINEKGRVLKQAKDLKTSSEQEAWSWLDILCNNIKRLLAKIPGGSSQLFTYAAALYLLHEPVDKLREASEWTEGSLAETILGPTGNKYLSEAIILSEDAPANAAGTGGIAGIGVGPHGEPGGKVKRKKFAGHEVFEVDGDTFHKSQFGKTKHGRYKKYVGEDETGQAIRSFGRKNKGKAIIVMHPSTGAMSYLRRYGKYT